MINKLFTFIVRISITIGISFIAGLVVNNVIGSRDFGVMLTMGILFIFGGIYTLIKFNAPYRISALDRLDDKFNKLITSKNKRRIEEDMFRIEGDMLRLKKLFESGILTQDEYDNKFSSLNCQRRKMQKNIENT